MNKLRREGRTTELILKLSRYLLSDVIRLDILVSKSRDLAELIYPLVKKKIGRRAGE